MSKLHEQKSPTLTFAVKIFLTANVPFSKNFDCLTCIEVLVHLDEPEIFLGTAVQHLREGGTAVVTVPSGPRTAFDVSVGHRRHYKPRELKKLMETAGFSWVSVPRVGFPFFDLYRTVILIRSRS